MQGDPFKMSKLVGFTCNTGNTTKRKTEFIRLLQYANFHNDLLISSLCTTNIQCTVNRPTL